MFYFNPAHSVCLSRLVYLHFCRSIWPNSILFNKQYFYPRCARDLLSSRVRPSVCLSVTSRNCTKTAKHRITQTTPHDDSSGTPVSWCKICLWNFDKITSNRPTGRQMQVRYVKFAFNDQSRRLRLRRFAAENLYPFATVVRVQDGALAAEYAV